jgi:hypothetical protein
MAKRVNRSTGRVNQIGITIKERDASIPLKDHGKFRLKSCLSQPFSVGVMELWGHGDHQAILSFFINPCRYFLSKYISKPGLENKKCSQLQIYVTERAKL